MILISCTYQTITPESAEHGDIAGSGFNFEDVPYTLKELVELIKNDGFTNPSSWPATGSTSEWLSTEGDTDFQTGEEETLSLHFSRANNARSAKYWRKAFIVCNIIKNRK